MNIARGIEYELSLEIPLAEMNDRINALLEQSIKDFYENEELIAITKEMTETLCENQTID